jgi:hypothetical protein
MKRLSRGIAVERIFRWLIAAAALLGCAQVSKAQVFGDSLAHNSVLLELGGPGEIYSLNYERLVGRRAVARVGLTSWGFTNFVHEYHSTTKAIVGAARLIDLSFLPGQRETWAELGFTVSAGRRSIRSQSGSASGPWLAGNGIAGFRFQGAGRGLSFRVVYSPFYVLDNVGDAPPKGFSHASAASIGWAY